MAGLLLLNMGPMPSNIYSPTQDDSALSCFQTNHGERPLVTIAITHMLETLKWPTLEKHRENVCLLLLFKHVNNLLTIPATYTPVLFPLTTS